MSKIVTTRYDVAEHLRTPEEMVAYLEACLDEADGDATFIAKALGDIARAKGMSQVARDAGLSRESLYKRHRAKSKFRHNSQGYSSVGLEIARRSSSYAKLSGPTSRSSRLLCCESP